MTTQDRQTVGPERLPPLKADAGATAKPANIAISRNNRKIKFTFRFRDRGFLREGAPADIVVFDLEYLSTGPVEGVRDLPGGDWRRVQKPESCRWTLVNGEITLEDGEETGARTGKLLRHGVG